MPLILAHSIAASIILGLAYILGSILSAIVICYLFKLPNPREHGSYNPGATNVLRLGGKLPAFLTLVGDAIKGIPLIIFCTALDLPRSYAVLATIGAVLGHMYPLFFHFKGGKGVATALGCLIALNFPTGLCALAIWLIMAALFRYSSLASMSAITLTPFILYYFTEDYVASALISCLSVLIILKHKVNIKHLLQGTERKLGQPK